MRGGRRCVVVAGYVSYGLNGTYGCVERISGYVVGEAVEVVRWVLVCIVFGLVWFG